MRGRWMLALCSLAMAQGALAQSDSLNLDDHATVAQTAQGSQQATSYMIAPGVSVTPLYQGAQPSISTYTPDATQGTYAPQAYASAGDGAAYPQSSYSQPLGYGAAGTPGPTAGYTPQTPYDNTPYRFNMQQNGRQMSADDFAAWMQSRGIHIAGGKR